MSASSQSGLFASPFQVHLAIIISIIVNIIINMIITIEVHLPWSGANTRVTGQMWIVAGLSPPQNQYWSQVVKQVDQVNQEKQVNQVNQVDQVKQVNHLVAGSVNWEVSILSRAIVSRLRWLKQGSTCAVDGKWVTASAAVAWGGASTNLGNAHSHCHYRHRSPVFLSTPESLPRWL